MITNGYSTRAAKFSRIMHHTICVCRMYRAIAHQPPSLLCVLCGKKTFHYKKLKAEGEVERHQDRFSQAAGEWRDMSFGERVPYEDMAKMDKDRHQSDLNTASKAVASVKATKAAPKHGNAPIINRHVSYCVASRLSRVTDRRVFGDCSTPLRRTTYIWSVRLSMVSTAWYMFYGCTLE